MRALLRLVLAVLTGLLLPLLWLRRLRAAPKGAWLTLTVDGAAPDFTAPRPWWARWRRPALSTYALSRAIDELLAVPHVEGLVVTLKSFRGGLASATALRHELARVRRAGRKVVVHVPHGAETKELFVASAGTTIAAGPRTTIAPLGFAARVRYLRALLDKLAVRPEVYAQGRFKSAGETLTLERMSEPQREQTTAVLEVLYTSVVESLAEGRGRPEAEIRALVDEAPYVAEEAQARGLVDVLAYDDEVRGLLGPKEPAVPVVSLDVFVRRRRAPTLPRVLPQSVVGVVLVHGSIVQRRGPGLDVVAAEEEIVGAVRLARRSRRVRAVVLHIDSPGGSALASDRIHHELVQLAKEKPLVACFANAAASGGYYVACAAHTIVAQPVSITGSIGVVAVRFALEPLLEKLGVRTETVKRGARADFMDPLRAFDEADRAILDRELRAIYDGFVGVVAAGRGRAKDEIYPLAEGRVYSGQGAKAIGLVDTFGGFPQALAIARDRAGRGGHALEPRILVARSAGAPLPTPAGAPSPASAGAPARALVALGIPPELLSFLTGRERVLALCTEALLARS